MTDSSETAEAVEKQGGTSPRRSHSRGFGAGFLVKLGLMALVNAFGIYGIVVSAMVGSWAICLFLAIALILADVIYFVPARRLLPGKYLYPGLLMLVVFQVFVILYTGMTAFTNYGDGHNGSKEDAVAQLTTTYEQRVEGTPERAVTVLREDDGDLALAAVQGEEVEVGSADQPLTVDTSARTDGDRVTSVDGYDVLDYAQVASSAQELAELRVPVSEDPVDGALRTADGRTAYVWEPTLSYDEATDSMIADDGTVYRDTGEGSFVSEAGEELRPGWREFVGFENFAAIFDPEILGGPFVSVTLWTFAFAVLSVALTFFLGLLLAILLNDPQLRGRGIYRAILFLPYAFPMFLSALIWAGLLNTDYGWINQTLLGGAGIPWLENAWLARASVLLVNLWLGFPYMFLICTGALQSIPSEIYESASMDGAGPVRRFRSITLPMLMVAVGPLLIASFAMNFNNFNVIYLLTGGGPVDLESTTGVGGTDILITFVYKIAFAGGTNDYGLAAALSILIFLMVALISLLTFRRSQALEEIN